MAGEKPHEHLILEERDVLWIGKAEEERAGSGTDTSENACCFESCEQRFFGFGRRGVREEVDLLKGLACMLEDRGWVVLGHHAGKEGAVFAVGSEWMSAT